MVFFGAEAIVVAIACTDYDSTQFVVMCVQLTVNSRRCLVVVIIAVVFFARLIGQLTMPHRHGQIYGLFGIRIGICK